MSKTIKTVMAVATTGAFIASGTPISTSMPSARIPVSRRMTHPRGPASRG